MIDKENVCAVMEKGCVCVCVCVCVCARARTRTHAHMCSPAEACWALALHGVVAGHLPARLLPF